MQTLFRATVMIAVGFGVVKGWQLYGPTNEQVKAAASQGLQFVQSKLQTAQPSKPMQDPRLGSPRLTTNAPVAPPALNTLAPNAAPPAPVAQTEAPRLLPNSTAPAIQPNPPEPVSAPSAPTTTTGADRAKELISHLVQLGASEAKLSPWGDGKLYRFSCRAPLVAAPAMTQHFESVAAEPAEAVQQVMAKVEAWQLAQRESRILR
jgi:hypothetical protein